MNLSNSNVRWGFVAQAFHWLMFLLILGAWFAQRADLLDRALVHDHQPVRQRAAPASQRGGHRIAGDAGG